MIFFPPHLRKLAKVKRVNFIFGGIVVSTVTLRQEGPGWAFHFSICTYILGALDSPIKMKIICDK